MNDPMKGQYEVKIIPKALGNHQIDFRIKNQSIHNSPFNIIVPNYRDPKSIPNQPTFTFGEDRSNDGQFNYPEGICINSKNQIIVTDSWNYYIQIFDEDGKFILKFGSEGDDEQFNGARGIAIDHDDNIYVVDSWNNRIQIFNSDGSTHIRSFGTYGSNNGQFCYPENICIDSDNGNIIVVDSGNHRIQIFDKDGKFIHKFGKKGKRKGEMNYPFGIALNSKKQIIVGENHINRIQIFNYQGNHLKFIGENDLQNPQGISLDAQGNIYVADGDEDDGGNIKVFDVESGQLIHTFGNGSLKNPYGIAYQSDSQRFWTTDSKNHNISVF